MQYDFRTYFVLPMNIMQYKETSADKNGRKDFKIYEEKNIGDDDVSYDVNRIIANNSICSGYSDF